MNAIMALALNITIQTYAGSVDFGIVADKKALPHVQDLADALETAFQEARGIFLPVPARQQKGRSPNGYGNFKTAPQPRPSSAQPGPARARISRAAGVRRRVAGLARVDACSGE